MMDARRPSLSVAVLSERLKSTQRLPTISPFSAGLSFLVSFAVTVICFHLR